MLKTIFQMTLAVSRFFFVLKYETHDIVYIVYGICMILNKKLTILGCYDRLNLVFETKKKLRAFRKPSI